jgi:hypothetical protein
MQSLVAVKLGKATDSQGRKAMTEKMGKETWDDWTAREDINPHTSKRWFVARTLQGNPSIKSYHRDKRAGVVYYPTQEGAERRAASLNRLTLQQGKVEKHDYEPGESTHPMQTDPSCQVCGLPKGSYVHP